MDGAFEKGCAPFHKIIAKPSIARASSCKATSIVYLPIFFGATLVSRPRRPCLVDAEASSLITARFGGRGGRRFRPPDDAISSLGSAGGRIQLAALMPICRFRASGTEPENSERRYKRSRSDFRALRPANEKGLTGIRLRRRGKEYGKATTLNLKGFADAWVPEYLGQVPRTSTEAHGSRHRGEDSPAKKSPSGASCTRRPNQG